MVWYGIAWEKDRLVDQETELFSDDLDNVAGDGSGSSSGRPSLLVGRRKALTMLESGKGLAVAVPPTATSATNAATSSGTSGATTTSSTTSSSSSSSTAPSLSSTPATTTST
jgi:hypothetical protein